MEYSGRTRKEEYAMAEKEKRRVPDGGGSERLDRENRGDQSELRLAARGVLANSPWKIFVSFKTVIAAAFATGAYALTFPTIWQLADTFGLPRLIGLMVAAMFALVFWMIIGHSLWERSADEADIDERVSASMQNIVTLLTLSVAVVISYAVLFSLLFTAAYIFISNGIFESNLGHPVGVADYAILAWVATSVSTITGALGSGLEDDARMREAVNYR